MFQNRKIRDKNFDNLWDDRRLSIFLFIEKKMVNRNSEWYYDLQLKKCLLFLEQLSHSVSFSRRGARLGTFVDSLTANVVFYLCRAMERNLLSSLFFIGRILVSVSEAE